jgi:hypothetical protein
MRRDRVWQANANAPVTGGQRVGCTAWFPAGNSGRIQFPRDHRIAPIAAIRQAILDGPIKGGV